MKTDMTTGNIPGHLAKFAVPLILGNLFQLTYNAADSILVGRYVGDAAQASVGTANPLMNILLFFIIGACTGAGVLLSEFFGAKNSEAFRLELATGLAAGGLFSLLLSVLFAVLAWPLLWCIRTPGEILGAAAGYLAIISGALLFTFLYNFFAAALRSVGDAKTPLKFLMISALVNIGLDCLFIIGLHLGVVGAALATLCAEALSAGLCMLYAYRRVPELWVPLKELRIHRDYLRRTVHYAWATGMQKVALMVGKVLVQAVVNPLGIATIAAFNAVNRVDDFVFEPAQSIGAAITTFTAQNRGAKKPQRLQKALWAGMALEMGYWVVIGTIIWLSAPAVMALFMKDPANEAAQLGVTYLRTMAFIYILPGITNGLQGYVRGFGRMQVCLIATSLQMAGRVLAVTLLVPLLGIAGVAYSCLFGWLIMLSYEVPWVWHNLRGAQE